MDLDPGEENPMWARREMLAVSPHASHRGSTPRLDELACRVALASAAVGALLDGQRGAACVTQVITWDAPLILLADDTSLADRMRALGIAVVLRGGTYAERQWDAREALEEAAHRYYDHGEGQWGVRGMVTRQPRTTVAIVEGAAQVRSLLAGLVQYGGSPGLLLDAREPMDVRVFAIESLADDRVTVVRPDRVEEHRRDAVVAQVLPELLRGD